MSLSNITSNSTDYILEQKDNHSKIEVEIGDVKDVDIFQPQVKLKYWDNETNFSIRYDYNNDNASNELKDNKVIWKSSDNKREVNLYEIEGYEDGGFEFEVILNEKPTSNIIQFTIETKGFKFRKQVDPQTLPENIRDRLYSPDNVIGSYTAYHESKKNDLLLVGGKNYKTGKAFHIYRPRIEDSDNKWIWGDLNIDTENNLLTVTIPQDFIDNAIYPIRHAAGLTLGYTSLGGTNFGLSADDAIYSDGGAASVDGLVSKITAYIKCDASGSDNWKGCIWNGNTLISNGVSTVGTCVSTSVSLRDATYSTEPSVLTTGNYNVGLVDEGDAPNIDIQIDNASTGDGNFESHSYASPSNLSSPLFALDPTVYATYEPPPILLHYTKDGIVVVDIELYSDTIGWNSFLAVRADGATKYAQLDSNLSHTYASDLRVRQDGTTYAVLTEEGTPT